MNSSTFTLSLFLSVVFLVLKLTNVIQWDWVAVFAPLIIWIGVWLVMFVLSFVLMLLALLITAIVGK